MVPIDTKKERMKNKAEAIRKSMAACYANSGLEIPRHLLPDLKDNEWRRYELEKEFLLTPISQEEYERRLAEIAP